MLTIYDQQMHLLGFVEHADGIAYSLKHNDLWTAEFSLPAEDPENDLCQPFHRVRLEDGGRDLGLYRIIAQPDSQESGMGAQKHYRLEHVMATLLDDLLFGYHEIGGTGVTTEQVAAYILSAQTTQLWQLGTVDFTDEYQYHFENTDLLSALMSLGEVITGEYTWEFDTTTTPWTVSLKEADAEDGCGIYYGRNLQEITKDMDESTLVTRLYPLGYGEGVNQLTIRDANNGLPYLEADTATIWGVKCKPYTDTRIEDAETLKAKAQQILEAYKNPYITYTAKALDLFRLTGEQWDNYMPGKMVMVHDQEHGITLHARIVEISKQDVNGDPGDMTITIANAPRDAADSLSALADRMGIHELYSQGATNLFAIPFADNADATHPAIMRVYIPEGLVRINRMPITWQARPFRAYETGAAAGGGTTKTSSSGGGGTQTTTSKEAEAVTSEFAGEASITKQLTADVEASCGGPVIGGSAQTTTGPAGAHTHTIDSHHHSISNHVHSISSGSSVTGGWSGGTQNTRPGASDVDDHVHGMNHTHAIGAYVTIPPLTVDVPNHAHTLTIPGHRHSVTVTAHTHDVTLQDHTHAIQYGIYEGTTAQTCALYVDDTQVPNITGNHGETDITPYLETDDNGKILRGQWHEIKIVPDRLSRIEASLFAQVFIQSIGGGDY